MGNKVNPRNGLSFKVLTVMKAKKNALPLLLAANLMVKTVIRSPSKVKTNIRAIFLLHLIKRHSYRIVRELKMILMMTEMVINVLAMTM